MRTTRILIAGLISMGITACGGSSSGVGVASKPSQFDSFSDQLTRISGYQDRLSRRQIDSGTVLGSGSFTGVAIYSEIQTDSNRTPVSIVGDLRLSVDFSRTANSVNGQISNLVGLFDEKYMGTLRLTSGQIDASNDAISGYAISARLSGDIQSLDGPSFSTQGGLDADFYGPHHQVISGISFLNLRSATETISMRGVIAAEAR